MNRPSRFAFLDEGEALRTLGVDRDTLQALVKEGRLRAYRGFGTGSFFRTSDLEELYTELRGEELAAATSGAEPAGGRKVFDPAYKVHVRLQADLKWYDLDDDDLRAWVREMTADGYARQRTNVTRVIERLQRLVGLMDEAAAGWQHLAPPEPVGTVGNAAEKKTRRPLPMATAAPQAQMPPLPAPPPASPPTPAPQKKARKPLPMAGGFTPVSPPSDQDESR